MLSWNIGVSSGYFQNRAFRLHNLLLVSRQIPSGQLLLNLRARVKVRRDCLLGLEVDVALASGVHLGQAEGNSGGGSGDGSEGKNKNRRSAAVEDGGWNWNAEGRELSRVLLPEIKPPVLLAADYAM